MGFYAQGNKEAEEYSGRATEPQFTSDDYMMLYTTIYNMCTQKPPHDYSKPLYDKYKESFEEYIISTERSFKADELMEFYKVAERQGKFLMELFNKIGKQEGGKALSANGIPFGDSFVYKHLGSMASVGAYKALVDLRKSKDAEGLSLAGFVSRLARR